MIAKKIITTGGVTVALFVSVGCSNHDGPTPPGPGPTATPDSYNGRPINPNSAINTEMRRDGSPPMADPAR